METVFGLNFFVFCILVLVVVMYFTKGVRDEGFEDAKETFFGTSPGTNVQLEASRAPKEVDSDKAEIPVQHDILDSTEAGSFDAHYASA